MSPPSTRDPAGTRARLLGAASAVVRADGAQALTLDAVAARAGVSKGGLLYHFKSKRELVAALLVAWLDAFEAEIDQAAEPGPGGWTRAFVEAGARPFGEDELATDFAILAAAVEEPAQRAVVGERYAAWQARIAADGLDAATATLARLATDGLWLSDLLGLAPPTGALREAVLERLRGLAAPAPG